MTVAVEVLWLLALIGCVVIALLIDRMDVLEKREDEFEAGLRQLLAEIKLIEEAPPKVQAQDDPCSTPNKITPEVVLSVEDRFARDLRPYLLGKFSKWCVRRFGDDTGVLECEAWADWKNHKVFWSISDPAASPQAVAEKLLALRYTPANSGNFTTPFT